MLFDIIGITCNTDNANSNVSKSFDFSKALLEYCRSIIAGIDTNEMFVSIDVNVLWERIKELIQDAETNSFLQRCCLT